MVRLAQHYKSDLCYWAFQTLPPPVGGENNISNADADSLLRLGTCPTPTPAFRGHTDLAYDPTVASGTLANKRFHALMGNGVMEGGISTSGNLVNQNLCARGVLKGLRCDERILNSTMPVPAAIQMIRISQHNNSAAVNSNITAWRTKASLHLPNMNWAGSSGWGDAGGAFFKVLRCDDIPTLFRSGTKDRDADTLMDDGENFLDATTRQWEKMESVCPPSLWHKPVNGTGDRGCGLPRRH